MIALFDFPPKFFFPSHVFLFLIFSVLSSFLFLLFWLSLVSIYVCPSICNLHVYFEVPKALKQTCRPVITIEQKHVLATKKQMSLWLLRAVYSPSHISPSRHCLLTSLAPANALWTHQAKSFLGIPQAASSHMKASHYSTKPGKTLLNRK